MNKHTRGRKSIPPPAPTHTLNTHAIKHARVIPLRTIIPRPASLRAALGESKGKQKSSLRRPCPGLWVGRVPIRTRGSCTTNNMSHEPWPSSGGGFGKRVNMILCEGVTSFAPSWLGGALESTCENRCHGKHPLTVNVLVWQQCPWCVSCKHEGRVRLNFPFRIIFLTFFSGNQLAVQAFKSIRIKYFQKLGELKFFIPFFILSKRTMTNHLIQRYNLK